MTIKPSTRSAIELGCGLIVGFAFVYGFIAAVWAVLEYILLVASFGQ